MKDSEKYIREINVLEQFSLMESGVSRSNISPHLG